MEVACRNILFFCCLTREENVRPSIVDAYNSTGEETIWISVLDISYVPPYFVDALGKGRWSEGKQRNEGGSHFWGEKGMDFWLRLLTLFTLEGSKYSSCCYQIKISMSVCVWENCSSHVLSDCSKSCLSDYHGCRSAMPSALFKYPTHLGASIPLPCPKTSFPSPFSSSSSAKHSKQPSSSPSSSVSQNKSSLETQTSSNSWHKHKHQMILQTQNQWTMLFNVDAFFASWDCRYELFVHC